MFYLKLKNKYKNNPAFLKKIKKAIDWTGLFPELSNRINIRIIQIQGLEVDIKLNGDWTDLYGDSLAAYHKKCEEVKKEQEPYDARTEFENLYR